MELALAEQMVLEVPTLAGAPQGGNCERPLTRGRAEPREKSLAVVTGRPLSD